MTTPKNVQILIVDDHPIVRKGLVEIINEIHQLEVVAQASSAGEALELLQDLSVDVVVSDIDMPGMDGIGLLRELQARAQSVPVVLLTMHESEQLFNEAINSGASAFLLKDEALVNIAESILAVARGETYVSPALSKYVMRRASRATSFRETTPGLAGLTPTERRVLKGVAENYSSQEIAAHLGVSYRTITTHRNNISNKLGLNGKHPLLNFALSNQSAILSMED